LNAPNDLEAFWLPFTPNRHFKAHPRLLAKAEGMYYEDVSGRKVLDGISGLWCVNAGHAAKPVVEAIQRQAQELDFAPSFQFGHPKAFELASRIAGMAPEGLDYTFFVNSGSEAAESASSSCSPRRLPPSPSSPSGGFSRRTTGSSSGRGRSSRFENPKCSRNLGVVP